MRINGRFLEAMLGHHMLCDSDRREIAKIEVYGFCNLVTTCGEAVGRTNDADFDARKEWEVGAERRKSWHGTASKPSQTPNAKGTGTGAGADTHTQRRNALMGDQAKGGDVIDGYLRTTGMS